MILKALTYIIENMPGMPKDPELLRELEKAGREYERQLAEAVSLDDELRRHLIPSANPFFWAKDNIGWVALIVATVALVRTFL